MVALPKPAATASSRSIVDPADIFHRELAGEVISVNDPEYQRIDALIHQAQQVIA